MIMRLLLLALLISGVRSQARPLECEVKCGDEEGKPTLCQHFCARSSDLPVSAFLNGEFGPGVKSLLANRDWDQEEISAEDREKLERIVGGQQAENYGKYPFMASLKVKVGNGNSARNFAHFCGGSAIAENYILTAAHCVVDMKIKRLWVSIGDHDTRKLDDQEKIIKADKIIIHSKYKPTNFFNDIALIKLREPFTIVQNRQIIPRMPDPRFFENALSQGNGMTTTVIGWGTMRSGGQTAKILRYVDLPYVGLQKCKKAMYPLDIFDTMVCAGFLKFGGKDACQGDSGGPLVYKKDDARKIFALDKEVDARRQDVAHPNDDRHKHGMVLAGLVSWGVGCAKPGYAGVYTNVGSYKEWLDNNMKFN